MSTASVADRFWKKVNRNGPWSVQRGAPGRCWVWTAARRPDGYGQFRVGGRIGGRNVRAHRLSYELLIGPIPEGLVTDHLCRNRACLNPDHLEVVTHQENVRRGNSPSAIAAREALCAQGHPFDDANTYRRPNGRRLCRTCQRARSVVEYARRKARQTAA